MLFTDKIYGQIDITEPVILELINTPQMQRLKKIHQNGIFFYFLPSVNTTRFEHSLGVYWILKEFVATLEEQVAGLLHDISHGVFSHVMDFFYETYGEENYQELIHHQYFEDNQVSHILEKYEFNPQSIAALNKWPLAAGPLPDICADRLQYCLGDAITVERIDAKTAQKFIKKLIIENNKFIFQNKYLAKEFAALSLWMCQNWWSANFGCYSYSLIKEILKKALVKTIITEADFLTDDELVINKLENSGVQEVISLMAKLKNLKKERVVEDKDDYEYLRDVSKMRAVDPLVKINGQFKRITEIFPDFREKFEQERQRVSRSRYLKYS